jgi:uncharacterized repeat protein (TIGR01451 family)
MPNKVFQLVFKIAFLFLMCSSSVFAASIPTVANSSPVESFIGEPFCFNANFTNSSPDIGYGPYYLLQLAPDLTYQSATFSGLDLELVSNQTYTTTGTLNDPISGLPFTGTEGGSLVALTIPVGSVSNNQQPLTVEVCLNLDLNADPNVLQTDAIGVVPGFQFGDSATGTKGDDTIVGTADNNDFTPTVIKYSVSDTQPESENPPGPQWTYPIVAIADIASTATVSPITFPTITLPGNVKYQGPFNIIGGTSCSISPDEATLASSTGIGNDVDIIISCASGTGTSNQSQDIRADFDVYITDTLNSMTCDSDSAINSAKHLVLRKSATGTGTPGSTITYTYAYQTSEYIDGINNFTVTDILQDGISYSEVAPNQIQLSIVHNGTNSATTTLNVAYTDSGTSSTFENADILAAIISAGGSIGPAENGTVTYTAIIDQTYNNNEPILTRDTINNDVTATYGLSDASGAQGCFEDSSASVTIEDITISKTTISSSTVKPGDVVHFQLAIEIPSGDANNVVMTDVLPLPVFTAIDFPAATRTSTTAYPGSAAAGNFIEYAAASEYDGDFTVTRDGGSNSININFGNINTSTANSKNIVIDVYALASDEPYADGLSLANLLNASTNNSAVDNATNNTVTQITVRAPDVTITKEITSDTSDLDAGDQIDYKITLENIGGADAFDVTVTDVFESTLNSSSCTIPVLAGVSGGSSGTLATGLTLNNTLGAAETATLTFSCNIDGSIGANTDINNTAQMTFAAGSMQAAFPVRESTISATSISPSVEKTLVSTSETDSTVSDSRTELAIGEIARFRIVTAIPEGVHSTVNLRDLLPPELIYQNDGSAKIGFVGGSLNSSEVTDPGTCTYTLANASSSPDCDITATNASFSAGTDPNFNLGTVTNSDDDADVEYIVLEINAVKVDSDSVNFSNQGRYIDSTGSYTSSAINLKRVDPTLTLGKSAGNTGGDAGDSITYTLTITAPPSSDSSAFDIELVDILPNELVYKNGSAAFGSCAGISTFDVSNPNTTGIKLTVDKLAASESCVFTYDANVSSAASPGQDITNNATLDWTSLAGSGSTLSGSSPGTEKSYQTTDSATVTVELTTSVKSIVSTNFTHTSEAGTGASGSERLLSIGEEIKYRLVVTVPEGRADNFIVRDNLPAGLEYVNAKAFISLVSNGALNSSYGGGLCAGGVATSTDPNVSPDCAITPTLGTSGNSVDFDLGNVTNSDADGDIEYIVIEFSALVSNQLSNQQNVILSNQFEVLLSTVQNSVSSTVLAKLVEPTLSLTSATTPSSVDNRTDDTPTFAWTLVLKNDGLAQAFQVQDGDNTNWQIQLPDGVENITSLNVSNTGIVVDNTDLTTTITSSDFTVSGADSNLLSINRIFAMSPAATLTITFNTNLQSTVKPGSTLTANTDVDYAGQQTGAAAENVRNFVDIATGTGNNPVTSNSAPLNNYRTQTATSVVTTTSTPVIGVAKELISNTFDPADGTFDLVYRFYVENSGDVSLTNIQLTDDLAATFSPIASGDIDVTSITSTDFTVDGTFDGITNKTLIDNTTPSTLAIGVTKTLDITVTVSPGSDLGTYNNSVTAAAESARDDTNTTSDTSVNGNDPDPANDGPSNDTSTTPATFAVDPNLGLAKSVNGSIQNNADGTYTFNYQFNIQNTGDVNLTNLQIVDNLNSTFASADSFSISTPTSSDFTVNSSFNGVGDTNLLAPSQSLVVGASGLIGLEVTVTPGSTLTYNNSATTSASSPNGAANDTSDNGTDPETNNGNTADDDATPVTFAEAPAIGVAKTVSAGPTNNGDGTHTLTYSMVVKNTGDISLTNVQVVDDLTTTFSGATFVVDGKSTGGTLTINSAFNGGTDKNLLAASQSLVVGASETITLTVTVTPGTNLGAYNNTATAGATSPSGATVNDTSDNGTDPETNNGNTANDDVTPVTFAEAPAIGVAKTVSAGPTNNGDGTHTLTYSMVVKNTGDISLTNIQVVDDLTTTFSGATFVVDAKSTGGTLTINSAFNGGTDKNLLAASQSLVVGASETITLTVTVTPGTNLGAYNNTATAGATSPSGATVSDASDNGTDPETNNGNTANDDVTPVTFAEAPAIGVAKTVSAGPTNNGDGTHTLTYSMVVKNTGDISLTNVQVVDDLTTTFSGATFVVDAKSTGGTLTINSAFNGGTDKNLLAASQSLVVGASETITLTVTVTPGTNLGAYNNTATAGATSPSGATVSDASDNGTDPETNNGSGGLSDSTPVSFVENPAIGVAKSISAGPTNNGDGTYTLTYALVVKNTGAINLTSVQVVDDLNTTFSGASYVVDSKSTVGSLNINNAFNGDTDKNLLAANQSLSDGSQDTISVTVTVTPGSTPTYSNSATGSGNSPSGATVNDISDAGSDPESNNGAGGLDDATTVNFDESPAIGIAKRISSAVVNNNDGSYTLTYTMLVQNNGDIELNAVQIFEDFSVTYPSPATVQVNNVISNNFTLNASFDGYSDKNLLAANQTLTSGALASSSATLDLTVTITPGANLGPYNNTAKVNGTSPSGAVISDDSDDGTDANGDNGDGNLATPTPVTFTEAPAIGIAKEISGPVTNNEDGTYSLIYSIVVRNIGDVVLSDVQVVEPLSSTFNGAGFTVGTISSADLNINTDFNGDSDSNLLDLGQSLAINTSATILVPVTITPGSNLGPYSNTAVASGKSPSGDDLTDNSDNGSNPTTNNGDAGNDDATIITFTEAPAISIAKAMTGVINLSDGRYQVSYQFNTKNTGDIVLKDLQITEDLANIFSDANTFSVLSLGSTQLTVNSNFDGDTDTRLLDLNQTLEASASATINLSVIITPASDLGPYNNSVTLSSTSPSGDNFSDVSDNGTDPEGNNGEGGLDDTTPITFTEAPAIGIAKLLVAEPVNNSDGSYNLSYQLVVENIGDISLSNVQIVEDLRATFPAPATFSVNALSANTLTVNADFDGETNTNIFAANQSLAVSAKDTLLLQLTVTPGANLGPYNNTAVASGQSPSGDDVSDNSDNGSNTSGDNGAGTNDDVTPVTFTEAPAIGVAKAMTNVTNNGDGTYALTYTFNLKNTGDIALANVQVVDDLMATFQNQNIYTITSLSSASLLVNANFNGNSDINLLAANQNLALGASDVITLVLVLTPADNLGPYDNSAQASGNSPSGSNISDVSDNGTDPEGNNGEGGLDDTTPITFTEAPAIGIAKLLVAEPVNNSDGSYNLSYQLVVENIGDISLSNVQIDEDLRATFPAPATFVVNALSANTLTVNADFDGETDTNIFAANQSLAVSAKDTLLLQLTVTPGANLGPYNNTAVASAQSPSGDDVSDNSDNGSNTSGDNGAGTNDDVTPVTFTEAPAIGVAKAMTNVTNNGDGTYALTYTFNLKNTGDIALANVQVVDDLMATFQNQNIYTITSLSSASLLVNANFNGNSDINLLAANQNLALGASDVITLVLVLTPADNLGPYDNSAQASGNSPSGSNISDVSDNGTDPEGNNGEGGLNDTTPITFTEAPAIGIANLLVAEPVNNSDGSYNLSYQLVVENIGDISLSNVQIVEDLRATFPAPATFVVNALSANTLTVNADFDGETDTNIFATNQNLAVSAKDTLLLQLTVTPGANLGPYNNTAVASGQSPSGADVNDSSDNGSNTAGDNGDGTDNDPTPVTFTEAPAIGVAKTVSGEIVPTVNGSVGNFDVPFALVIQNNGDVPLTNIQLVDDLSARFGSAYVSVSEAAEITATTAEETPNLNANFPINLFDGTSGRLMPGQSLNISFTLELNPGAEEAKGIITNQAQAIGTSSGGMEVNDLSDSGTNASNNPSTGGDNPSAPGNSSGGTDDPTPFELPAGSLQGIVWIDTDRNDVISEGEPLLISWTIQVTDTNGNIVATVLTDENGFFQIENLPQGDYTVDFITPNGTTFFSTVTSIPANESVNIPVPVDPSGVVYDSISRIPITNTLVSIINEAGTLLPDVCLLPNQQDQITGDDGYYFFLLFLGADPACQHNDTFTLVVTAPEEEYQPSHSNLILPRVGALDPTGHQNPLALSNLATAPAIGEDTTYYMAFTLAQGDPDVINNHIPVDKIGVNPSMIRLTKSANTKQTLIGGLVRYNIQIENISEVDVENLTLIDYLPAGFTYVENSAYTNDADSAMQITSKQPLTVSGIDVPAESSVEFVYILRVGAGVARGKHINRVSPYLGSAPIGNEATATVIVGADPDFEEVTILGKVFDDRDSDNWQDSANASALFIQGGIAEGHYVANSTFIIDADGQRQLTDASAPLNHGIDLGDLTGRSSEADKATNHQIIIRQQLSDLVFTNDLVLTTAEGTHITMSSQGESRVNPIGEMADGLSSQDLRINRNITMLANGNYQVDLVIQNIGIQEIGIPGVRVATVEGLYIETDLHGRFHLEAVDVANLARGRNFYMKVDKATLPPETVFVSENPRVKRITQGLPTRFDFAIQLAKQQLGGGEQHALVKLGELLFNEDSAEINTEHKAWLTQMSDAINQYQGGTIQIIAQAHTQALAYQRANNTYQWLLPLIREDLRPAFSVELVEEVNEHFAPIVNISTQTQLGKILFDSDKSRVKAKYQPLLDSIAKQLASAESGHLAITGFADGTASADYNLGLGLRRAKAVFEQLKTRMPAEVWEKLTIKIQKLKTENSMTEDK